MATILMVDDEEIVVNLVRAALESAGHSVHAASSGGEANEVASGMDRIDVLIVNHRVPPDTGRQIAARLRRAHPEAKVMHVSGYPRDFLDKEGSLTPGSAFLHKPFKVREIRDMIAALLSEDQLIG